MNISTPDTVVVPVASAGEESNLNKEYPEEYQGKTDSDDPIASRNRNTANEEEALRVMDLVI